MNKKIFMAFLLCLAMSITALADEQTNQISGFRGYEWGTSFDEIFDAEITDEVVYGVYDDDDTKFLVFSDYDKLPTDAELSAISLSDQTVGGINATADYVFADGQLCFGKYSMHSLSDDELGLLIGKYIDQYGEPFYGMELEMPYIWIDDSGNVIILMNEMLPAICYVQSDSQIWSEFDILCDACMQITFTDFLDLFETYMSTDGI